VISNGYFERALISKTTKRSMFDYNSACLFIE
jgi:hypothetical protein